MNAISKKRLEKMVLSLKKRREKMNMLQSDFAMDFPKRGGIGRTIISKFENGSRQPDLGLLIFYIVQCKITDKEILTWVHILCDEMRAEIKRMAEMELEETD